MEKLNKYLGYKQEDNTNKYIMAKNIEDIDYEENYDREYVDLSTSYSVYLTHIGYNSKYRNIVKIHKLSNNRILSSEYYKKNKDLVLSKMKVYYTKNTKILRKKSLDYYYNTRRKTALKKIICECGRTVSKGNHITHLKSNIHKKWMKKKK